MRHAVMNIGYPERHLSPVVLFVSGVFDLNDDEEFLRWADVVAGLELERRGSEAEVLFTLVRQALPSEA
jgi:hypothetical protein